MFNTLRATAALLLGYGILLLANGLFTTLLGIRTKLEGFSTETIGLIMSCYFLGLFIGARFGVRVVAAVGHIRAFAAFASLISITSLIHAVYINLVLWCGLRILAGFCMAGMIMVTESWLNERANKGTRGQILSFYMITNYAAAGMAQFLLPLADPARFHLFSLVSVLYSLALLPVLLTRSEAPKPVQPTAAHLLELFRTSPAGVVGTFCAGMLASSFYALAPVFTKSIGMSLEKTSIFMACGILGGLILQWPMGFLADRVDRRWILTGTAAATACSSLLIVVFMQANGFWLFTAVAMYGSVLFTIYSHSSAHTNDFATPEKLLQVASGLLIVYSTGAVLGPILGAQAMGFFGPQGLFEFSAIIAGFLVLFVLLRSRKHRTRAAKQRRRFIPIPSTQYTSAEIYRASRDQRDRDMARMIGGR